MENWALIWVNESNFVLNVETIDGHEVWENKQKVVVIHPLEGLKLMYHPSYFENKNQKDVISCELLDQKEKIEKARERDQLLKKIAKEKFDGAQLSYVLKQQN